MLNLPIFPIAPGAKGPPLIRNWPVKARPDYPIPDGHNYGVECSGLCVVDVDPRSGGDKTFEELGLFEGWPDTFTVRTPSGGRHHYYRMPVGTQARNSAGLLGPGIDTKGRAGYVVGHGSRIAAGEYALERDIPIAPAPQWLVDRVIGGERADKAPSADVPDAGDDTLARAEEWLTKRPKGEGAYAIACGLRDVGVSLEQALALMAAHDPRSNVPEKVRHAYTYAQNEPGAAIAKPEDFEVLVEEAPAVAPTAAAPRARRLLDFARAESKPAGYLIKGLLSKQSYAMIYGQPGAGKAQPLDERVLTPDGWQLMGDVRPGSYVIGSAGFPVLVTAVYPQGDKDEWEVEFENGTIVRCCGEHLWTVYKTGALPQTVSTVELAAKPHKTRWHVPLVRPVGYTPSGNPLPLDPYVLGALLGDGGITAYVGFTSADAEVVSEVRRRLPGGHDLRQKAGNKGYDYQIISPRGQPNGVWNALRLLGLAGKTSPEKSVPEEYITASPAERLLLLQGLMDTDGWSQGGRVVMFASSSRILTEQVAELVGSLGGVAGRIRAKKTEGLDSHSVAFSMPAGTSPFRLPRKAVRVSQGRGSALAVVAVRKTGRSVPMQCIAVASTDHLYVTTGFVLTHNTFVALDLAYHVAAGREWNSRRVKAGGVLYLAYEGMGGMTKRAQALLQHYGDADVPLYIQPASYDLRTGEGRRALAKDLAALPEVPGLIVFDTFAHALMGGDENSAQDVGAFNTGVAALIKATGACVIILHHPRKSGDSARGSSALLGAVDTEIQVADRAIKPTKQRDVELGEPIGFALKPVMVGMDEDGDSITSCVVVPAAIMPPVSDKVRRLKGKPKLAWEVLCDKRPTNAGITDVEWLDACTEFIAGPRARQAWYEVKNRLRRDKLVVLNDGLFTRRLE